MTVDVVLTEAEDTSFLSAMATQGYSCIDDALSNINSDAATATEPADLRAIRALVTTLPGGFDTLDAVVRGHLHQ